MSARVDVDDAALLAYVERVVRETHAVAIEAMEAEIRDLQAEVESRWPVQDRSRYPRRRGEPHSRDLFATETVITPTHIDVRLTNRAAYLFYIRTHQNNVDGNAFQKLIRRPMKERTARLAADLEREFLRMAGK